jgi:hypothetical protein
MATNNASSLPTEEYLTEVADALTYVMGEEGPGRQIVDDMRDCYRLDALKRIQDATESEVVFREMRRYLEDAPVCLVGLRSLAKMMMYQEDRLEDIAALPCTELYLSCLSNHLTNERLQLLSLLLLLHCMLRHSSDANSVEFCSSLADAGVAPVLFLAMENHTSNNGIVRSALMLLASQVGVSRGRQAFFEYCDAHPEWDRIVVTAAATQRTHGTSLTAVAHLRRAHIRRAFEA